MYNMLIQIFASGATGFNIYTSEGMYGTFRASYPFRSRPLRSSREMGADMALWLAMRDAIAVVTPYEDLIVDGVPAPDGVFTHESSTALVSSMMSVSSSKTCGPGTLLIASSTIPAGLPTAFTVTLPVLGGGKISPGWLLCDLVTLKSVAPTGKSATWKSDNERGSVLLFGEKTPCHA